MEFLKQNFIQIYLSYENSIKQVQNTKIAFAVKKKIIKVFEVPSFKASCFIPLHLLSQPDIRSPVHR
jgi:hypothetical protein